MNVSPQDLQATYLPAFHTTIVEGKAASTMCAYNAIDGAPACASDMLLQKTLRGEWKFDGFVTSDCWAVTDIWKGHKLRRTRNMPRRLRCAPEPIPVAALNSGP